MKTLRISNALLIRSALLLLFVLLCPAPERSLGQAAGDLNYGSRVSLDPNTHAPVFSWWGPAGAPFLVEYSSDVQHWTYVNTLVTGADAPLSLGLPPPAAGRLFVRLQTDPFFTDTDEDGIPDGWEILHGLNPRNPADANAIAPGGLTYLSAYLNGVDPNDPMQGAAPAAPTGLLIFLPDAAMNPQDPDLSQIQVKWNSPAESGVTVTLGQTYAGSPGNVFVPVSLSSATHSPVFTDLPSRRIHQYRVTFTGSNGQASSTDIAYEVPVIRGMLVRKTLSDNATSAQPTFIFPARWFYPAGPGGTGVARKFTSYTHTWDDMGAIHGSESQSYVFSTRSFQKASHNWDDQAEATYSLTGTEPSPGSPNGSATEVSKSYNSAGILTSSARNVLGFTLQPYVTQDAMGAEAPLQPFLSLAEGSHEEGDSYDVNADQHHPWYETPSLVSDADGQHLAWSGMQASYAGKIDYQTHGYSVSVAADAVLTDTNNGTVSWTYSHPGWTEKWTLSGEMTTDALVNAAAAAQAPLNIIPWYLPDGTADQYEYTNQYAVAKDGLYVTPEASPWLWWDYDSSYISGNTYPASTLYPGSGGYVTVPVTCATTVGQYTLSADETNGRLLSSQYKYRLYPPAESATIAWLETFTPDASEADQTPQYKVRTYTVPPGQTLMPDSALLAVDRTQAWSSTVTAVAAAPGAAPQPPPALGPKGTVNADPLQRVMRWEPFWPNVEDNKMVTQIDGTGAPLQSTWMPGKGSRIFPDKATPTGFAHPDCTLYIKGVPNKTVYLKSFDVDDATPESFDKQPGTNNPVIDTNGRAGNDNRSVDPAYPPTGSFPIGTASATRQILLDANGEARVTFVATMCPGDNFRVAMSETQADLNLLQVDNPNAAGYIAPDSIQQPANFPGIVSPMLTVWRKLYLEIDSMDAVPSPRAPPDESVATGQSWVTNINGQLVLRLDHALAVPHFFTNGTVSNGASVLKIVDSDLTFVVVKETLTVQEQQAFLVPGLHIKDDDDKSLAELGLTPVLPKGSQNGEIVSGIMAKFAPAYIQVMDANALGFNPRQTIPFQANASPTSVLTSLNAAKDLQDDPGFWTHEIVFAYQPDPSKDGDYNRDKDNATVTYGETPKHRISGESYGFSVVYLETIRQGSIGDNWLTTTASQKNDGIMFYKNFLYGIVAHEMGHSPGLQSPDTDHKEQGLMQDGAALINLAGFTPVPIKRFRNATRWEH